MFNLQAENQNLKCQMNERMQPCDEEEIDVTIEGAEEEESSELWDAWEEELSLSQRTKPGSSADVTPGTESSAACGKTVRLQLESEELKERLMVSEATVQAQAAQLKDYRELLSESYITLCDFDHACECSRQAPCCSRDSGAAGQ